MRFTLYADGACRNNQSKENIGAYAFTLKSEDGSIYTQGSSAIKNTTNNKMELMGAISALRSLAPYCVIYDVVQATLITDSMYVVKGMNEWIDNWKKKGWINSQKKPVENRDLWEELDRLRWDIVKTTPLYFLHTKGHSTSEGNNFVDLLCNQAMDNYRR